MGSELAELKSVVESLQKEVVRLNGPFSFPSDTLIYCTKLI
jgi:hypothetical protein